MGLIGRIVGGAAATQALGEAAQGVAEVFTANATRRMELSHEALTAAMDAQTAEFEHVQDGWFSRMMNAVNRLPRPALALGTLGLFVFAMTNPVGFAERMQGLAYVPEPLWWLLGAIVSFYFGAREMHYFRNPAARIVPPVPARPARRHAGADANPALTDWRRSRAG